MAAKYGNRTVDGINEAARQAGNLVRHARDVQAFFRQKFAEGDQAHTHVRYLGDVEGVPLAFRLDTPFGEVRADFGIARVGDVLVGRYAFSRVAQLASGDVEAKECYAFIFSRQGVGSFDETLDQDWTFSLTDYASEQHAFNVANQLLGHLIESLPVV
ncbi:MAG: hypothetical protein JO278_11565 [Dyella sp.]|nr:hypothetical protein [Dyella sp.]